MLNTFACPPALSLYALVTLQLPCACKDTELDFAAPSPIKVPYSSGLSVLVLGCDRSYAVITGIASHTSA